MKTHPKKQVRIICEMPILRRLRTLLARSPITGYTILPVIGGAGSEGEWSREGMIGDAGQMVVILVILDQKELDAFLDDIYSVISDQIGIITVSDVEVVRPDRF
jgi:PII-like signaling protein